MKIRKAQEKDIPRIGDLLSQVLEVHHQGRPDIFKTGVKKYTDDQLCEILVNQDRPIFVAEDSEGVVQGYVFCIFERRIGHSVLKDITSLYIDDLCVDESARGQKIGTALYEYVLDFARAHDCYNVTLNVWNCNQAAMKFYETCGLVPQRYGMEFIL